MLYSSNFDPELYFGSGNGCVDKRTGFCYSDFNVTRTGHKVCGSPLGEEGPRSACCCSVGTAWGPDCEKCPEPGTPEFDLVCPGGVGFQPNPHTVILEDINECNELNKMCKNGRCSNTFGSYMCTCDSGYTLDESLVSPLLIGHRHIYRKTGL